MNKSKVKAGDNVVYVWRDKDGNIKPLFVENFIARFLRKIGYHLPKIPFLIGMWKNKMIIANLVVDTGKAGVASRINGAGAEALFDFIAIGTGATAPVAGNTTLETEIASGGGSRAASTVSRTTTNVTNDTAQNQHTFTFSAGFAVTETGVFNAGAGGVMLARQTFSPINVAISDSLQITWQFDVD